MVSIYNDIINLIEEAEEIQRPSFYKRHKKKILVAGALGALAAGTAAGYKGLLGPNIQKAIADTAFKASADVAQKGLKIEGSKGPKFSKVIGQKIARLGHKGMISSGKESLRARKVLVDRGIRDALDTANGIRNELNSKFNINPFRDPGKSS